MVYYVYKVTNIMNNKWYVGKRKHTSPYEDQYMGSGQLIKAAIQKHGKQNFSKEILRIFETNDEAAQFEASLVTREAIKDALTYNLHEGGHGGFGHINSLPPEERINIKAFRQKVASGEIKVGGSNNWPDETRKAAISRLRRGGKINYTAAIKQKMSNAKKGKNNNNYKKVWIYNPILRINRYEVLETIPEGWFRGRKMEYYQKCADLID